MDEHTDIQKDDPISRFFDDHTVRTNPFGENRTGERVYRRAERLVAALHLVTSHIDPNEPLREAVRTSSLALLEETLSLREEMRVADSSGSGACRASIRHLISLMRLLAVSGFVSMQNAHVVVEALDELGNFLLAAQRSPLSEKLSFSREAFHDPHVRENVARIVKDIKDTGFIKDKISVKDSSEVSLKETEAQISGRKASVLGVLQAGKEYGIRDIAAYLPELAKKPYSVNFRS